MWIHNTNLTLSFSSSRAVVGVVVVVVVGVVVVVVVVPVEDIKSEEGKNELYLKCESWKIISYCA
jgi:predicted membrane protein